MKRLRAHPVFLRAQHIACYMAADGEIELQPLMQVIEALGKRCYLPVLHPLKKGHLWFVPYRSGDAMAANRYGIAEPRAQRQHLLPWALDLVLMPLVGFDRQGHRLGMGGGYYDRTFAFRKTNALGRSMPILMGVAHACQETEQLTIEDWDIPLDFVATDKEIIRAAVLQSD